MEGPIEGERPTSFPSILRHHLLLLSIRLYDQAFQEQEMEFCRHPT